MPAIEGGNPVLQGFSTRWAPGSGAEFVAGHKSLRKPHGPWRTSERNQGRREAIELVSLQKSPSLRD